MIARARGGNLPVSSVLALALALAIGLFAADEPFLAIGIVLAMAFALVVFADLAAGFAVLGFLSFLDVLPTSGGLSLSKGAGLLLAIAWVARSFTRQREGDFLSGHPVLTWVLLAFLAWASMTLLWAQEVGPGVTAISRYGLNILVLPIAYTAVRTRRDLIIVLGSIALGAFVAGAFAIVKPPSPELIEGRATGTIGDPNEFAAALLLGLTLGVGFALSRGRPLVLRLGGLAIIPICALGIFLSLSRGGLIALMAVLLAGTVLAGRWRVAMMALTVVVAASGILYFTAIASPPARERVTTADGGSGRSDLWTIGLRMVRAHPVGGVGVGNFPAASPKYALQPGLLKRSELIFAVAPKITHNTYLQILAEMGFVGLALFMGIVLTCLLCALRAARLWSGRGEIGMEALARSTLLALIGLLVADFFISQMYSKLLWVMLALGPAMLSVARREAIDQRPPVDDSDRFSVAIEQHST